jgi:hypothetical protein
MVMLKNDRIRGLYIYEILGLGQAGLYCGLTTRDEPGITEWMDYEVFRRLSQRGIHRLILGGAEKVGISRYIDKLLAQKPTYTSHSYAYDPEADAFYDVAVRLAKPADFQALSKLYADFYNDLDDLGERWTKDAARKFISHFYTRQRDLMFLAEDQKSHEVVGLVMAAVQPWWDGNHLVEGELLVRADYRAHPAYATQLVSALLQTAEASYQAITWDTIAPTTPGHPFNYFQQLGFSEVPHWRAVRGDVRAILGQLKLPQIRTPDARTTKN